MHHSLSTAGQAPAPRVPTAETTPPAAGRVFADSSAPAGPTAGQAGGLGSERLPGRPFDPAQLPLRDSPRRPSVAAPGALVVGVHLHELRVLLGRTVQDAARLAGCRPADVEALEAGTPSVGAAFGVLSGLLASYRAPALTDEERRELLFSPGRAVDSAAGQGGRLSALECGALSRSSHPRSLPLPLRTDELVALDAKSGSGRNISAPWRKAWERARREQRTVPVTFLGEDVLMHDPYGRPDVMARQFTHLWDLVEDGWAHIRIVPRAAAGQVPDVVHEIMALRGVVYGVEDTSAVTYHSSDTLDGARLAARLKALGTVALKPIESHGRLADARTGFLLRHSGGSAA
ncbi:Scr1 family TA system antitoxin-like transcriptional regulator [Streptomyces sp. BE147]|uniref:Scr1 family TA system antitoxin-like transcriptional regulator n=1 Tax=Streptomyces sp. BE147 TaxID=3002524 RepID=UPI002E75EBD8|nr:Scr1 family TA system antitoxin-like transcriptional regulator [Streptomyces sp. BE147]MEE1742277.1 Scr1 family TA system antitoxin-like transcriptional regulator [Streptomyces sp. BE147]